MNYKQISWKQLENFAKRLSLKINPKPKQIVCIGSGGLILGKLISDNLDIPLATIMVQRYKKNTFSTERFLMGKISSTKPLEGRILLLDDLVDEGITLEKIKNKLLKNPYITELKTATIYKKNMSKFTPDYYLKKTDRWIIFPYEKKEFKRILQ